MCIRDRAETWASGFRSPNSSDATTTSAYWPGCRFSFAQQYQTGWKSRRRRFSASVGLWFWLGWSCRIFSWGGRACLLEARGWGSRRWWRRRRQCRTGSCGSGKSEGCRTQTPSSWRGSWAHLAGCLQPKTAPSWGQRLSCRGLGPRPNPLFQQIRPGYVECWCCTQPPC